MKTCVFCNRPLSGVASNEHILPQWLLDEFKIGDAAISPTHLCADGTIASTRHHTLDGLVAGRVCSTCNNGWMSDLERAAKPHLLNLCSNSASVVDYDTATRLVIARWAMKTALTLNLGSNFHRNIPGLHYHHICNSSSTLPERVVVFAQNHQFNREFDWVQSPTWMITDATDTVNDSTIQYLKGHSYKIAFQLRGLLIVVAFNPLEDYLFSMWRGIHVPLYPERGPIGWYDRQGFPWNDSQTALYSFHVGVELVRAPQ
jgi:hypothetical protein